MSYQRALEAQEQGVFKDEIVGLPEQDKAGNEITIEQDDELMNFRPDKFPSLRPAFGKNGTITAANASKISDGASALVLMDEQVANERGLKPLARIRSFEDAAVSPIDFGIAPAKACDKLLKKAGLSMLDIDYHEINEAFSAVALANIRLLDLDPA